MNSNAVLQRVLAVVAVLVALIVVGGAATPSHAATSFTITLDPLIGSSDNTIPTVSFGGKIGYHLFVRNTGDSNTTQASIVVDSDFATFSDSDNASCAINLKDSTQMVCAPNGGTLNAGATFDVNLRFTAPSSGTQVSTTAFISIKAQSVGGKNHGTNGTTVAQIQNPVLTNIVENSTKDDTYLHANENAATGKLDLPGGHPQNFSLNTPGTLLGNPFGIAVSMHDIVGTLCTGCFDAYTQLTIPAASLVTKPGNVFYDGTNVNPFTWAMNAQYAQGSNFKLNGIVHIDDNGNFIQVPSCASLVDPLTNPSGNPTAADPVCYDTKDQLSNKKMLVATGRGLENGNMGWN